MTNSNFSGPLMTYGKMLAVGSVPENNEMAGPNAAYQGAAALDVRYQFNKDNMRPGLARGFVDSSSIYSVDAVPQTLGTAAIAGAQAVAGAGLLTLAATSTKTACARVPVVGSNSTTGVATETMALDLGFQTVNVNGTTTVTIAAGTANRFPVGGWIWIGGTTGGAGTFTRVTANAGLSTTTTITISPAVANTAASAPVATTNLLHAYAPSVPAPTSVSPWIAAGALGYFDPTQALTRCVQTVSTGAGDTTQTLTVRGFDIFLNPMSELIASNGTTPVVGVKAWKYITSITASAAYAGNVSVGTTDTLGINLRSDFFEHARIVYNSAVVTAITGWTAGDQAVATATTGDVRGRYALQTASNGTRRLTVLQELPPWQIVNTLPASAAPMFGVTQFTS